MIETAKTIMLKWAVAFSFTGSRYICNPAPTDSDEDYVCLATDGLRKALELAGATVDGDPERYEGMSDFVSMRLGDINMVLTDSPYFYRRFVEATEEAKRLNLLKKPDRIALFQKRLYGVDQNSEIPL